ncbi:diguanylate cyclase [Rhizobium sp. LjRoot254]|uniref:diguanylate cyclase n=1 Tax=Rhizobium sp. LjRoot254 TaxID=3342297 RepID=UPI003ECE62F6
MNGVWAQFAGNLAFVGLAISLWAHVSIWFQRELGNYSRIAFGVAAGATSIGSILLAVQFSPGVYIDLRFPPIAIAGLFGGPITAIVAALMAVTFRIAIGGAAMAEGVMAIAIVAGIGVAINFYSRKRSPVFSDVAILTGAIGVSLVVMLIVFPTLAKVHALQLIGQPMIGFNCLATALCGFIILKTEHLELERSMLGTSFSQAPDFLYIKDRDSRFIIVNENMAKLYRHRTSSGLTGLTDFDLHATLLAEELYHNEQELMRTGVPMIDALEHIGDRYMLASKVPVRNKDGRVIGLAGVTRDITERTALEHELRESRNLLSHAMAGMSDGFAMFDKKGFLIFCNEQYREAFPLSRDARVVGAHISDILRRIAETRERLDVPTENIEDWIKAAAATLHRNKDEEIQLHNGDWRSIRTRLADNGMAMVAVSDITATKQAEIALRISAEQLKNLAETDGLTGIVNRRAFDEAFMRELARSARNRKPLSLLMIDIDRFKAYNDTYGHLAGDQCLRVISKCLLQSARRPVDIVARYGGEEFVVLLPEIDEEGAMVVAELFAHYLSEENIAHTKSEFGKVTASIGISSETGLVLRTEPSRLLSIADAALYDAKARGRNRIIYRAREEAEDKKTG